MLIFKGTKLIISQKGKIMITYLDGKTVLSKTEKEELSILKDLYDEDARYILFPEKELTGENNFFVCDALEDGSRGKVRAIISGDAYDILKRFLEKELYEKIREFELIDILNLIENGKSVEVRSAEEILQPYKIGWVEISSNSPGYIVIRDYSTKTSGRRPISSTLDAVIVYNEYPRDGSNNFPLKS